MEQKSGSIVKIGMVVSVSALVLSGMAYFSPKQQSDPLSSSTADEKVKSILIDTIRQNPQLIMDAMSDGISKKREDTIKQLSNDILSNKEEIAKYGFKFGKGAAKTKIIAFFDPLCKHCIEFQRSVVKMVKAKKNIAFNMIPIPILEGDSLVLSKVYIAAYDKGPEKALAFMEKITEEGSAMDKAAIDKALKAAGLDSKDIEKAMDDAEKRAMDNRAFAEKLNIPLVPAIFVLDPKGGSNMIQATSVEELSQFEDSDQETKQDKAEEKKIVDDSKVVVKAEDENSKAKPKKGKKDKEAESSAKKK